MYFMPKEGIGEKTNIAQIWGNIKRTLGKFMTSEDVSNLLVSGLIGRQVPRKPRLVGGVKGHN